MKNKYCFQCPFLHYPENSVHHPSLMIFMWETSIFKINTIIILILFMTQVIILLYYLWSHLILKTSNKPVLLLLLHRWGSWGTNLVICLKSYSWQKEKLKKKKDWNIVIWSSKVCAFQNLVFLLEEVMWN